MTDEPQRKTVKPAHPNACIPDPAHPGHDIAAEGTSVVWDSYWIGRFNRDEIVIADDVPAPAPTAE